MVYIGDFKADTDTVYFQFNTRKSTGEPVELLNGVFDVFRDGETTPITMYSVPMHTEISTGQYAVEVYFSPIDPAAMPAGADYSVVLTRGTVDGIDVSGTVLAQFSIENRYTATDGTTAAQLAAIRAKTDLIGTGTLTVVSPVTAAGEINIIQGDTYSASEVSWTDTGATWPADLDTADSIICCIADEAELACTYAAGTITLDALSCIETASIAAGRYPYWLEAQWHGDPDTIKTLARGTFTVTHERPEVTA